MTSVRAERRSTNTGVSMSRFTTAYPIRVSMVGVEANTLAWLATDVLPTFAQSLRDDRHRYTGPDGRRVAAECETLAQRADTLSKLLMDELGMPHDGHAQRYGDKANDCLDTQHGAVDALSR
jgi:hypothetical protein